MGLRLDLRALESAATLSPMTVRYRILTGPVRQFLRERKLDHDDFAARIDVNPQHFSRVLRGKTPLTFEMGTRIANGLYVHLDAVMEPIEPTTAPDANDEREAVSS
jgi:transcriptional regulator with XRE-family HTH domain